MWTKKEVSKEVELEEGEEIPKEEKKDDEPVKVVNDEGENNEPIQDEKAKKKTKTVKETVWDWE